MFSETHLELDCFGGQLHQFRFRNRAAPFRDDRGPVDLDGAAEAVSMNSKRLPICFPLIVLCLLNTVVAGPFWLHLDNDDLRRAVGQIDSLRQSPVNRTAWETKIAEVLAGFDDPGQRAILLFHAANLYAQPGMLERDLVLKYAQESLRTLDDPTRRAALYVFCGDATRLRKDGESGREIRAEAADWYFKGLREVGPPPNSGEENEPLELMSIERPSERLADDGHVDATAIQKLELEARTRRDAQREKLKQRELRQMMNLHRQVLIQQVVSLYANHPEDRSLLEGSCQKAGVDSSLCRMILDKVPVPAEPAATPHVAGSRIPIWLAVNLGIAFCLSAGANWWRIRRRRPAKSGESS